MPESWNSLKALDPNRPIREADVVASANAEPRAPRIAVNIAMLPELLKSP
jgi:hypothetical protein